MDPGVGREGGLKEPSLMSRLYPTVFRQYMDTYNFYGGKWMSLCRPCHERCSSCFGIGPYSDQYFCYTVSEFFLYLTIIIIIIISIPIIIPLSSTKKPNESFPIKSSKDQMSKKKMSTGPRTILISR